MNHFTKYTACEWAPDGIRVNAIAPWYIRTPLAEGVLAHAEYADAVLSRTPARRVGEPSEVADALAYMASDAASYVSGTVLQVDGGFSASGFGFYDGFAIPAPKA
jgi:Tropinone reductase 1